MRINCLKMAFERISRLYEGNTVVPVNKAQSQDANFWVLIEMKSVRIFMIKGGNACPMPLANFC